MTRIPKEWANIKTVLSHDWLTGMRGGERVLELLCEAFPDAPLYTLIHNPSAIVSGINAHSIHTSFLQRVPGIFKRYRYFLPIYPLAVSRFRPEPADLLISTSHCVAKGLPRPPGARHLCYCFTPMRYAWTFYDEYFGDNPFKKAVLKPTLNALRNWDNENSARVDRFVAISHHVRKRIETFYGRSADVVYPPVDTDRCSPGASAGHEGYDLIVSALVPYKRIDLAVAAYTASNAPLTIIGTGTEFEALRRQAGPSITFLGWQTDDEILAHYRRCRMLIFPGEEDFGIVPLEAQACGKPVVAFNRGGALETIVPGVSGVLFDEQTPAALQQAIDQCAARDWDPVVIRKNAERFSIPNFFDGMAQSVHNCLTGKA